MELEAVKRYLEEGEEKKAATFDGLPLRFCERLTMQGLHIDLIEPGRIICSFKVPTRLLNSSNFLHGGATATLVDVLATAVIFSVGAPAPGVSVEIKVSYFDAAYADEEFEIEGRALHVGKAVGVFSVELRKKKTGKIIAQGRHSKYLAVSIKM
ncbi:Acyl-coenzyme A thioesterase 13 [Morella rubra]|uniref:Acyl-coenzyme A thioesterase 13 n=1 Tax=Morella rubra TaxID=262757 RepID=A0A6A1WTA7_9ROSI|nr:Acyl-coenzyme A thioesterase 13 [Morella rubra]